MFKKLVSSKGLLEDKVHYTIGLAGNPNVGKSTVFNNLTGMNQHTGNWPGKTVAIAEGIYKYKGKSFKIIDLPGTYSLLSDSEEEEIARNFICFEEYDLIVVVADATSLERNLNLFMQVTECTNDVLLCVNLIDEAEKKGIFINRDKLQEELNSNVIEICARKGKGLEELKEVIYKSVNSKGNVGKEIEYPEQIENAIEELEKELDYKNLKLSSKWVSLRLLEGNSSIKKRLLKEFEIKEDIIEKIKDKYNGEVFMDLIAGTLVKKAEVISKKVVESNENYSERDRRLDRILTSKLTGIPIMILVLLIVLWITVTFANYPSELLAKMFAYIEGYCREYLININAPSWISGVLMDGVYTTLAWVISVMLPPMAIFFPLFTLLEDFGYLPRIAFNLDSVFKKCCSCGKQALTMCMGLGCNAAGVIGCRIINSPRERLIAIITNNFMPCNGRFPIIITISTIFVTSYLGNRGSGFITALTITLVILLGVLMTFIISKFLSLTFLKGVPSNFILELPPYRAPEFGKVIVRSIFDRTLHVLGRAIVVAAPAGIVIWIFANVYIGDVSILSACAGFLEPLGRAVGLDGYIIMAFILGIPANEIVLPIIIMSYLKSTTMIELDSLQELNNLLVANGWTMITAINLVIFSVMHYPCATTLITIKKETKSWKWTILSFLIPTICGLIVCFFTNEIWKLFS